MPEENAEEGSGGSGEVPAERTLDLSGEEPESDRLGRPKDRPYDPEPEREKVRARIAYGLTAFVAIYAAGAFIALATGWAEIEDLERLQVYFTPVITLAATALGFYFGGKQR